jgi:hypothetical protein
MSTSVLAAAMVAFPLPVRLHGISVTFIGQFDPDNLVVAAGMLLLVSCL